MSKLKRMLALSGLTGVLGALAFAMPANAAVKALCVVDGEAKATTTKPTPVKYVQLSGGKGTFTFRALSIVCLDLQTSKGPVPTHSGTVDASGSFRNSEVIAGQSVETPCGAGKVMGKITGVAMPHPKFDVLLDKKFAVEFKPPTTGIFYWHESNPNKPTTLPKIKPDEDPQRFPDKPNPNGPKIYRYAGQIQLSPSQSTAKDPVSELTKFTDPANTNKCTKGFHVNGTVLVDEL